MLPIKGAIDLITQPVAGSLEYEPQVVDKIRRLTADQPYVIHLVCRALVDHCNKMQKNYATLNDVNQVQQDVLLSGSNHFGWLWERFKEDERLLLQVIAEGSKDEGRPLDLDEIKRLFARFRYPYEANKIKTSLKTLWAEDVIEVKSQEAQIAISDTARYALVNGLLRQWLKNDRPLQEFNSPADPPLSETQALSTSSRQDLPASSDMTPSDIEDQGLSAHQHNGSYKMP